MVIPPALLRPLRSRPDLAQFEKFEAERFDLRNDAEHRGPIFKQAGEHGLAAGQLRDHRGERGQGGSSEPTLYPDRVQARRGGHANDRAAPAGEPATPESGDCAHADPRAISAMLAKAGLRGAAACVRAERRQSDHAHRAWYRRGEYVC
jgi:hypothetical protein